jgi:hypothetical protein
MFFALVPPIDLVLGWSLLDFDWMYGRGSVNVISLIKKAYGILYQAVP